LTALTLVVCVVGAVFFDGTARAVLLFLAAFSVIACWIAYAFFMFKNPDKLQSEDYQIRKQALELIHEKGSSIAVEVTSVEAITNPALDVIGQRVLRSGEE
jgi:hypothetical protein